MIHRRGFSSRQLIGIFDDPKPHWRKVLKNLPYIAGQVNELVDTPLIREMLKANISEDVTREESVDVIQKTLIVLHRAAGARALHTLYKKQPTEMIMSVMPLVIGGAEMYSEREKELCGGEPFDVQMTVLYNLFSHLALEQYPLNPEEGLNKYLDEIPMAFNMALGLSEQFSEEYEQGLFEDVRVH